MLYQNDFEVINYESIRHCHNCDKDINIICDEHYSYRGVILCEECHEKLPYEKGE